MSSRPLTTLAPRADAPALGAELPVLGAPPAERCDAARNRVRILAAAERLFARDGIDRTSLDQVAAEAGVGKGTLFRRFGDREGLVRALLSDREAAFQEHVIRGPAPLGPGAPARERLLAFGPAMLAMVAAHGDLLRAAETASPGARWASAPYSVWRAHVRYLLREVDPALDDEPLADALLAPLGADLVMHQLHVLGLGLPRLADAWQELVRRLLR